MSEDKGQGAPIWVWALLISLVLLIGLPILGFGVGWRRIGTRDERPVGHWSPLGAPPETPVAFVDAGLYLVYVRGQGGSLFECDLDGDTADNACWRLAEQPQSIPHSVSLGTVYPGTKPLAPGQVAQSLDLVGHEYRESSVYVTYVILDDGSVWVWKHYANAVFNLFPIMGWPVCGLALALVGLLGIWLAVGVHALLRRRKARR